jgi:hypothetical protein
MWGTDLTLVMTCEGQPQCRSLPSPRAGKQAVRQCHGGFAKSIAAGLWLRHNHGDFQAEIRFLRIKGLPAFASEPEGNDCAER